MKRLYLPVLILITSFLMIPAEGQSQDIMLEAESGALWFSRNDVRIPNDGGTEFDMLGLIGQDAVPYFRLRLNATFGERHTFRALFAPISKVGTGAFDEPVDFEGSTYEADLATDGVYRFNTYRLTYRYTFLDRENWTLGAGAAALIRDAKVQLTQAGINEENTDLGFVPLIHLYAERRFGDRSSIIFDAETLASTQGRATDVSLTFNHRIGESWGLYGGYRLIEGGADVDEVYNFSWINFASVGVFINLW
ncbi:MAG: hypothetical protein JJU46_07590 [Balneolaceae bacterium]|nr:hypothetical protein [Balneolaceae bacterium]MCH8549447.1 hypothetical protein [Balneolaceae bacterium]